MKTQRLPAGRLAACAVAMFVASGCAFRVPMAGQPGFPADMLKEYRAYTPPTLDGPLHANTAVSLALKNDPDLAVLRDAVRVAEAQRRAVVQIDSPELRVSVGNQDRGRDQWETVPLTNSPWYQAMVDPLLTPGPVGTATGLTRVSGRSDSLSISLRATPPNPWVLKHRISGAGARMLAAVADLRTAEWTLAAEVQRTFETAQFLQQDLAAVEDLIRIHREMQRTLDAKAALGDATLSDMMTVSRRYLRAVADRDKTSRDFNLALRTLANFTGLARSAIRIPPGVPAITTIADELDFRQLRDAALKNRSDLTALLWRCHVAAAAVSEAKSENIPWIRYVQASYSRDLRDTFVDRNVSWTGADGTDVVIVSPNQVWDELTVEEWSVDAGISIPVFSLFTAPTAPARAEHKLAKTEFTAGWKNAISEIRDSLTDARTASANLARYRREAAPHLKRMRLLLELTQKQGGLPPDDIARTQDVIILTERTKRRLQHEYRTALISLREAVGVDLLSIPERLPPKANADTSAHSPDVPTLAK